MIVYKRNIEKKLLSFRIVFFILLTSCFLAFASQYNNLVYFLLIIFFTISIIGIKDFIVFEDYFQVSKYYFFGLIKRKWEFNKVDRIKVSSYYSDFGQNNDVSNYDDTGTGVGCLLSIILFFIPSKITNREFKIESLDDKNTAIKSVKIIIDNQEFNFIEDYYNANINYKKYITQLKRNTSNLSYKPQLKFAVLICKKLYFDYQKFTEVYNWGNANLLMDAILICEQAIEDTADINQINVALPKIDLIAPHMDDFGSELGSYALNASASVYETLQFISDKDSTHIYNIATYYTDTIDFKIQEEQELTQLEIDNHPKMIEAWNFVLEQTRNGF